MDMNSNMDALDDTLSLPEISFDDFLDSSPVKKNGKTADDEDSLEYESKSLEDDSLNTPGPKKTRIVTKALNTNYVTSKSIPMRSNPVKAGGSNQLTSYAKNGASGSGGNTSAPILLNSKNVLPKMATQITNSSIKITPKATTSSSAAGGSGGVVSAIGSGIAMGGKTAVRTSTRQLIYIQKSTTSSAAATNTSKAAGNVISGKQQTSINANTNSGNMGASSSANANKPVTIQVVRNSDGSFVPLKTSTAVAGVKNATLTLSPTALAGRKIVTTSGGQMFIKSGSTTTGVVNPNATAMKTLIKPVTASSSLNTEGGSKSKTIVVQTTGGGGGDSLPKSKAIFVQSNTGKQILVSNTNLVKLSPKPQTTTSTSSGLASTSSQAGAAGGGGQLQTIQVAGKQGVQYVRVVPTSSTSKTGVSQAIKTVTVSSATATSMAGATKMVTAIATTSSTTPTMVTSSSAPVKILNNLPQKFTVVQKGGGTKVVLTQKRDANGIEFAPVASKVQKTMVTLPILKSISEKTTANEAIKTSHNTTTNTINAQTSATSQPTLMRKHKISEINTEIKRITSSADKEDNGPPDIKKPTPNSRLVVISSHNAPTILNSGVQQQARLKTVANSGSLNTSSGGSVTLVQGTKTFVATSANSSSSATSMSTTTAPGNKLFTILKPSGQQNSAKLYSVLKTSNVTTTITPSQTTMTTSGEAQKFNLNKQALLQQQQKMFHQKQLQKSKTASGTSPTSTAIVVKSSSSSSSYYPIKIKEEPLEFPDNSTTATDKCISSPSSSSLLAPSTSTSTSIALQPLSMVPTELQDDPNKIDLVAGVRRKHCNCSKSQCLKLYCDCFANGEFCQDCTCKDCFNNLENEDERQRAIRSCLERNPSAFKPKITSSSDQGDMRLHNKGCNCKRSGCLKNYCECYEAKIPCSSNCKCVGCRNVEDRPDLDLDPVDPKLMATMANVSANAANQKRGYDKTQNVFIKTEKYGKDGIKSEAGIESGMDPQSNKDVLMVAEQPQCNFITQEVVDATIQCMVTQADECEKNGLPAYQMEKMVMEELGRCLVEIIDFSIRNTDTSYTQD
uniref:CRC domain-containing protein n=1 Tax=Stomoxys calcitrans TaxID=35570 RepID=A0A1I8QCR8_STOCA